MKSLFKLFFTFFKIGLFTFGGGYAMISQIKEAVVDNHKWLSEDELLEIVAISESTPGPIAINMATYVGYKRKGFLGSAFATLGVVLPSFIIIYIISLFAEEFKELKYVQYAFSGIKAAVAFLILKTGLSMFIKMKKKFLPILVFSSVFIIMILFEVLSVSFSAIYFIFVGGIIGIIAYCFVNTSKMEEKAE